MPSARHVSLVQKLRWHVSGNISPTAFAIGDVEGHGDNSFVIGNLVGELFIFKGNHPEGLPWLTCKGLGTITAVAIGDIRNWGKNSIVVLSAEGLCHIFDVSGLDEENNHATSSGMAMPPAPASASASALASGAGGVSTSRPSHAGSIYSSTPLHGSYQQLPGTNGSYQGQGISPSRPGIPATPSIRPVPDAHHSHGHNSTGHSHGHHSTSHPYHGTPPLPPPPQNTPHGSTSSSVSGFPQQHTPNATPIHSHSGSLHSGTNGGVRRGSEIFPGSGPAARTSAVLANLIGTPPPSSTSFSHGGRRVLERPNMTLPVPVNINRAHIADIDGDGQNELVLARTDRILHSYSLQAANKATSPTMSNYPSNQPLNLVKLLSRTSSISTLDSSGLLSPSEDRRDTVIHYPSMSSVGKQYHPSSAGAFQNPADAQDSGVAADNLNRLVLVEKKRWALDGQINCLSVTHDTNTGQPILLVAQPGLKFVKVDHTGQMSEPVTQAQRSQRPGTVAGPDTPTRCAGSGDVATDIVCGTRYVNGQRKDIIGLMSMDGAFALHDLEDNTAKVHDLDSTHKIFGFSKLNFGNNSLEHAALPGYRKPKRSFADQNAFDNLHDEHGAEETDSDMDDICAAEGSLRSLDNAGSSRERPSRSARKGGSQGPSLLLSGPYGSRFQRNDMFVGCSWSGITFFIDQEFNIAQYDFDARVCAFGAGQYAVTPGRNEPCLFYVDFEDNIYVYYNLYIQTEPPLQFQDIVRADTDLVRKSRMFQLAEKASTERCEETEPLSTDPTSTLLDSQNNHPDVNTLDESSMKAAPVWTERDMKEFIHGTLYNANRYEDEFQRLKRLANNERAKRAAYFEAEANKERELLGPHNGGVTGAAIDTNNAAEPQSRMDLRPRRPPFVRTSGTNDRMDSASGVPSRRRQYSGPDLGMMSSEYTQHQQQHPSGVRHQLPGSPGSSSAPSSPKKSQSHLERRRSSLLIKDVLSHYEGKITPPMKSPTSPSAASPFVPGHGKSGSFSVSGSAATLTNMMKRFSLKDIGNGGRLTRSSTASSSGSNNSSGSQSTITPGHPLLGAPTVNKGMALETRVGKALKANRPAGTPRNRHLGVMGRKLGTRSRLSLQQDREDDTEEGEDDMEQAPSDDGTGDMDGDNMLEYEVSSRRSMGDDEDQRAAEEEADAAVESNYRRARRTSHELHEGEDDAVGVYTPSTISPIPSPGRFYGSQHGSVAEPSPSLDSSAYALAKSLLSPSNRGVLSGSSAGAMGKHSRHHHADQDSQLQGQTTAAMSRGHARQRSGHGLLDVGLGVSTRDAGSQSSGVCSGPNSAGHSSNQDGRRSRAESVLSTGSDIGGVIVPDITLLASSFPAQSSIPLSTSEPLSHAVIMGDEKEDDGESSNDDDVEIAQGDDIDIDCHGQGQRATVVRGDGVRRPPRRSATLGSQDSATHVPGSGPGSGSVNVKLGNQKTSRSGTDGKGVDVKLMPAPLPRSSQHHQRHQLEQQGSSGTLQGQDAKDGTHPSSSHVSFSSNTRPNSSSSSSIGVTDQGDAHGVHGGGGNEGFGRGLAGKTSSTTSSAAASDFGSGPSSPLTTNVTSANAILSNPSSSNGFKGFSVLSLPVTSPSAAIVASGQQHQYFSSSHYHNAPQRAAHHLASSLHSRGSGGTHPHDITVVGGGGSGHHEDDRSSIRSRTSTFRDIDDSNDISSVLAAGSSFVGANTGGGAVDHGLYNMSMASASNTHLQSDSLVRRLEELQQQDHDLEERQRQKEKDKGKSAAPAAGSAKTQTQTRPSALSRANSGASVQSAVSHGGGHAHGGHRTSALAHGPPTSHGSGTGASTGGPPSSQGSTTGSGPTPGSGKGVVREDDHESSRRLKNRLGLDQGL
ncbi:integrin alpha FG-GAP repeat-containing protein 2 [Mortierella alpina]|nr:integrin alpha FG-GAP repeat-containing protein 2 [Mortierella alpina]